MINFIKQLFCKHEFEKTGTERYGGFLHKNGEITGGTLFIRGECIKCNKIIFIRDSSSNRIKEEVTKQD